MSAGLRGVAAAAALAAWLAPGPAAAWTHAEVVDGDTVTVHSSGGVTGFKIRLLGVDTPELRGRCPEETALAGRARDRLAALVAPGVTFQTDFEADQYGRMLGRLLLRDGREAGSVLIGEGLARAYDGRGARAGWCPAAPAPPPTGG